MPKASDNIVIRNIFYMIAYATGTIGSDAKTLLTSDPSFMGREEFKDISDLFAEVLVRAVNAQRTHGFDSQYFYIEKDLQTVRGKISLNRSLRLKAQGSTLLGCSYNELSANTLMNQIIKTAIRSLLKTSRLSDQSRKHLRETLPLLNNVGFLPNKAINWSSVQFTHQNQRYRFLMSICRIILENRVPLENENKDELSPSLFNEQRLSSLFEKFVREYFRKHFKALSPRAKVLKGGIEQSAPILPSLDTDVVLNGVNSTLIIDAKCYGQILKTHFDKKILAPEHRNQILSYVLHEARESDHVEGMLLYAESSSEDPIDVTWRELGHSFNARTLNLNCTFDAITQQLNQIGNALMAGESALVPHGTSNRTERLYSNKNS